jgi:lipopolysaccharide heptosyltransferase II
MFEPNWDDARRLLCIRLDAMGDVVMTEPALRALKRSTSGRRVTLLTSRAGAEVAPLLPDVDEVLVHDVPWMKATALRENSGADLSLIGELRRMRFDCAVIFTVYSQNPLPAAMMCYLADIPLRLAHCRENPYQLLTDWVREQEPELGVRHEVERQLDLVAEIGAVPQDLQIRLAVSDTARVRAVERLRLAGGDPDAPWLVIHPGASAASRRWPTEHFATVADQLSDVLDIQIVLTGSRSEADLVNQVGAQMRRPFCSLAGVLSISELTALLAQASLLVSNNTGPVHLASGVGTPVVDIYALTNPQHTPWLVPSRVLSYDVPCRHCYRSVCPEGHNDCIRRVTPQQVVSATLDLLAEIQGPVTVSRNALPMHCSTQLLTLDLKGA